MARQEQAPAPGKGARGSEIAPDDVRPGAYPEVEASSTVELIGAFIGAYRLAGGDASATMAATLSAFPGATAADFAAGLIRANQAEIMGYSLG